MQTHTFDQIRFEREPAPTPERRGTASSCEQVAPKQVSIFEYYDVENEIRDGLRMRRDGVDSAGVRAYVRENAVTFGLEFAGMVPHTSIAYHLDQESAELQYVASNGEHIRMRDSYEGLAEEKGPDSREYQEYQGYRICEEALARGATSATIISPPHEEAATFATAGYGLVMAMMRNEETPEDVRLHIFRYREPVGSLHRTNHIAQSLADAGMYACGPDDVQGVYASEVECRTNPIIAQVDANLEFAAILEAVELTPEELRFSALYEAKLRSELAPYLDQYVHFALAGEASAAKRALSAYFNAAKDLKIKLKQALAQEAHSSVPKQRIHASYSNGLKHDAEADRRILEAQYIMAQDASYNAPATAEAGGSCPVSSKGRVVSALSVERGLLSGQTPQTMLGGAAADSMDYKDDPNLCRCGNKEPHFHCPGTKDGRPCNHAIVVGEGTVKCPECGAGKVC